MALPKEITAALDAWKKGEGEFPDALSHGSFFENDGVLQKVINGKLGPAQKAARAEAEAQILEIVGVTDPEQLKEIKTKLAEAAGTLTEVEKLRGEKAKWSKDQDKQAALIADLAGFKTTVLKGRAVEPHLNKVAEPLRQMVRENIETKLKIEGDKVLGPDGVEVGAYVDELIKANPALKAPDFKEGAGTGAGGGKAKPAAKSKEKSGDDGGDGGGQSGSGANGQRLTLGGAFSQALREKAEAGDSQ